MQQYNTYIPLPEDIPISVFQSVEQQCAYDYTLQRFINITIGRTRNKYAPTIEYLRSIDKGTDKDRYDKVKRQLCAFSLSCRCTPGGSRTQHHTHNNGILCVDVDAQDNPHLHDWAKVRDALGRLKYCYLSALSAGGKGVFVVMAVDPDTPHEQSFEAVKSFFADRLRIVIDKSCRDIARLRFISYDPDAVVKQPTEVFTLMVAPDPIDTRHHRKSWTDQYSDQYDRVRAAVRVWVRKRIALDSFDDWTKAGAALKLLPDGQQLFDMISQYGSTYKGEADTQRKFERVENMQRINVASFFHLCRQYGITNDEISAELRAARGITATKTHPTERHVQSSAGHRGEWSADTAPPTPIAPGETEAQARANNAAMLNEAMIVRQLLKGTYRFEPPTPEMIRIIDPCAEAPATAPF